MKKQKRESDLICMWSGVETAGDKSIDGQEHIFPESIGGKHTLPAGDVSEGWNNRLGCLDKVLKKEHPAMKLAYQKDPSIKSKKKSNKSVKQRRKKRHSSEDWTEKLLSKRTRKLETLPLLMPAMILTMISPVLFTSAWQT